MPTAREQAEEIVDRQDEDARNRRISKIETDILTREGGRQHQEKRTREQAAWYREHRDQVRERAIVAFGEVAESLELRGYHLLSLEGRTRCFLFLSRERLEDARVVAERAGLGVDSYADHLNVTGADLADRWSGTVELIDPTDQEIRALAKKIDEQARKVARP